MDNEKDKLKKEFIRRLIRFSLAIIKFTEELKALKVSYSIIDQTIRSATSIGANVVEAKSAHSKKDYIKFFEIALKSANETKYWLYLIQEAWQKNNQTEGLLNEVEEISKILASSILTLKRKR